MDPFSQEKSPHKNEFGISFGPKGLLNNKAASNIDLKKELDTENVGFDDSIGGLNPHDATRS